jgi:hypothetical protein
MGARGQRLGEAQIREKLDLVDRWRGSGLSMRIAVGTPIAGRPPHRSERAQFTHSAPTLGT